MEVSKTATLFLGAELCAGIDINGLLGRDKGEVEDFDFLVPL